MYKLTHTITVFDPCSEALTDSEFQIGFRYTKDDGEIYDHLLAEPISKMKVKYVPVE